MKMKVKLNGQDVFIDFLHRRWDNNAEDSRGQTICEITEKGTKNVLFSGSSLCSSRDNFCKETGRKIALARAIRDLPRDVRQLVWADYFSRRTH